MSMLFSFLLYWFFFMEVYLANQLTHRGIIAGMDASQMGESLYEAQWAGEEDYHPFHQDASIRLE